MGYLCGRSPVHQGPGHAVRAVTVECGHVAEQRDLAEHVALREWREAAVRVADVEAAVGDHLEAVAGPQEVQEVPPPRRSKALANDRRNDVRASESAIGAL